MPSALKTARITNNQPAPSADQNGVIAVRAEYSLLTALALNDTIDFAKIPAGHIPVDVILDSDDVDTGGAPAAVFQVGLRAADGTTDDPDAFIKDSTVGQAGGVARANVVTAFRIGSHTADRNVYLTVSTAPATGATSGKIGVTVLYRPALKGA